jgi:hypothetical protein
MQIVEQVSSSTYKKLVVKDVTYEAFWNGHRWTYRYSCSGKPDPEIKYAHWINYLKFMEMAPKL